MKLINDKKFLTDIFRGGNNTGWDSRQVEKILSKHLLDLPKKETEAIGDLEVTYRAGYNQCLKDCEDK